MIGLCLALIVVAFVISLPGTVLARRLGVRWNAMDSSGSPGHQKDLRGVPNTGGMAIFWAIVLPLAGAILSTWIVPLSTWGEWSSELARHVPGARDKTWTAGALVACLAVLHIVGCIDDRRALPAGRKALVMCACAIAVTFATESRLLTMLDAYPGGVWISGAITVLWIVAITNAMNFIDNMDGLSAGVGAIAASSFLAGALVQGQWFVAACLAMLIGALLGFLCFNFPPASVFMGDGGSLVIGFLLAFLTVRTTYFAGEVAGSPDGRAIPAGHWYGVFMPIVILAVPLYDLVSVTIVRHTMGRSPFVGSPHHLSHRLVAHGMRTQDAVAVIWGLTAVTGLTGVVLGTLLPWQAVLAGTQVVLILMVMAIFEWRSARTRPPGA